MPSQNFVIGNKTKLFFTIQPDSLLETPVEPQDVTLTTSAAVSTGALTIPVTALTGPLPIGTPLKFTKAASPDVVAYTTASALAGATSISVEPVSAAIGSGAQALYKSMLLLLGGTTSDEQISANDTETTVYGDELGYSTGRVTSQSWQVTYSFNVLPSDPGYFRLSYAAVRAVNGVLGWLRKEDPVPTGYTKGESIAGLVAVTEFSKSNPADGIVGGSLSFKGRGAPIISHYS